MDKNIGVIYPIPFKFVNRIFEDKRNVFVKYVAHPNRRRISLKKVLFYESRGNKEIVGEATIKANEFLTPLEALEKYGDRVFLEKEELIEYASRQPLRTMSKKMLVLVLAKPTRYSNRIMYEKPMTMAGKYLTEKDYETLMLQNNKEKQ
jgi:hypothetical protein